ncbi:CgeB family protein [Pseudodesulfovibrio mercurii]|uniref:CgeB family protein n=1 Tax=Pseudodesulfovibrio mercurii TaxID=641491 RepID=F0JL70_9BACT|nr:glycosyltransferase [Pseudodesulfovibrio mercurii]EGB16669.1 CgeB family protein [Pseudodesulfovibrio mercurii]
MSPTPYTAEAVLDNNALADLRVRVQGKTWHLWGRDGRGREAELAAGVPDDGLPVLLGAGLGHALDLLLERGLPVAVADRENALLELTGALDGRSAGTCLHLDAPDPAEVVKRLGEWRKQHGGRPLVPVILPLYQRLDRDWYGALARTLKAGAATDFWSLARYPKFRNAGPRVLFLDSDYFLCREILAALDRLGAAHRTLPLDDREIGSGAFIEGLLKAVVDFRPDLVLTVNHFGLDREGKLAGLLDDLGLPLASWFVDNPRLILFDYDHPGADNTVIFTFDAGNLDEMRARGFRHVHYLPLATDPHRFRPDAGPAPSRWTADLSFVGSSMTRPVAKSLALAGLPTPLAREYRAVAGAFGRSGETSVTRFLAAERPAWLAAVTALPTREQRLAAEALLTWEATRQYRLACVRATLPFSPLIVGDDGWAGLLDGADARLLPPLDYYADLPRFYPRSKINFNCTSRQMKGAVNQRVFDVPACGGFLLTDHREQMEDLFDLDREAAVYRSVEEIPDLAQRFAADPAARTAVVRAAARRILAEHTYEHRLQRLLDVVRETFA